jgi:hypothetical protein
VGYWEELKDCNTPRRAFAGIGNTSKFGIPSNNRDGAPRDLFKPYGAVSSIAVPPPTYEESIQDLPPDYTTTDDQATVQVVKDAIAPEKAGICLDSEKVCRNKSGCCEFEVKVDFSKIDGIRSYANKKAKKAAKQAQRDKWADSDNEDKQDDGADGGDGGSGNGGGDGGSGAGGDGGDPPGGGDGGGDGGEDGGDGGDDWFDFGTSKKDKKKKKKNAWADLMEEEDEKKKEEEAKKAEEDAAAAANVNTAADADAMDDWGAFATVGKKKKGKKGKAEPEPPPPEPDPIVETIDLGASATADANMEDEWGGFTSAKKKKNKKGKVRDFLLFSCFLVSQFDVVTDSHMLHNSIRYRN